MRLALDQWRPVTAGIDEGLARLDRAAAKAAAGKADLLLLPEMALTGYNIGAEAVRAAADPEGGPVAIAMARIAQRHRIAIAAGLPCRADDGRIHNGARLFGRDGTGCAFYAKTHLYGNVDRSQFDAGTVLPAPVLLDGWAIGFAICYDIEFPEVARAQALAGADIILVPTANMLPYTTVATRLVPARAEENRVFIAYANYVGAEPPFDYCGLSCVSGPDGADLARAGAGEEMIFANLDRAALEAARADVTYLTDRRADLYGSLS